MSERATARSLSPGAGSCLILSLLFFVGGVYFMLVPVQVHSAQGPLDCGSALSPPRDAFAAGFCQSETELAWARAIASGTAGLAILAGGIWTFGWRRAQSLEPDGDEDLSPSR